MTASYLALGDSYTIGEGVTPQERWPNQLIAALRKHGIDIAEPQIIAKTGWTTDELNAAIDVWGRLSVGPALRFSLVTLLIGVNNQYRGQERENYRSEFASLLRRAIHFAGADARRVIVVSIPDWGVTQFAEGRDRSRVAAEIEVYNAVNREETRNENARYVDITSMSLEGASMVTSDRLHPSAEMYARWTAAILPEALAIVGGDTPIRGVS